MPEVYIGIGSNVAREANIRSGLKALAQEFGDIELSPVYCSEAVGFRGAAFLNLVARFSTALPVLELSQSLRAIERAHGRGDNMPKFSSRTLDLDILLYGDAEGEIDGVVLPREEVLYNAFVLRPLSELAPDGLHPRARKSFLELWQELSTSTEQRLEKVDL
ncbi:MAG: 2-amino-4-hydroxy-6-hydroxymethyldihydropteridine diphosphokinase [Bermanella sp.]|jgi:2-amino-4-hydroxy-6-hydroxymethyldihydropteridine diphosphokinase